MRHPLAQPDLSGNEEAYVREAIRSTWISSTGPFVERFEHEYAALSETGACIAVANGTVALHLALLALDLRPGDEVLIPSLTYVSTANVVRYCGAEPVFVDVDPNTWCIDPQLVEETITPRTKGIIPVHLYGHPADMDAINHIAGVHGLWVVEDAAEAHLARYRGRPVGGLSDMGTFSFYGNKLITSGEGGAITLDDPQLELRLRTLRGQGMDPNRRYFFPVVGRNYRLTNVACAILCGQLEHVDDMIRSRRAVFDRYLEHLDGCAGIGFQPKAPWADPAPWLFNVTVDPEIRGATAAEVRERLDSNGVETRPFFIPLHTLPPYRESASQRHTQLPVTDQLASQGISLPTYPQLQLDDIDRICSLVRSAVT